MMKRTLVISLLTFLIAVPVLAIDGRYDNVADNMGVPPAPPNWLAREADLNALSGKVAQVEHTLTEKVAHLKREIQNLQARLDSTDREARLKPGQEQALRKPSPGEGGAGGASLNALTQKVTEVEKTLTIMVAKLQDVRAGIQDVQTRGALTDRETRVKPAQARALRKTSPQAARPNPNALSLNTP